MNGPATRRTLTALGLLASAADIEPVGKWEGRSDRPRLRPRA